MTQKESGEFLKNKREEIGLSVEEVSSVLECDPSHLLSIESGEDLPSKDELSVLKHIYGLDKYNEKNKGGFLQSLRGFIPFFLNLIIFIIVNPFIPLYEFKGGYHSLIESLSVNFNDGQVLNGSIQLLIASLTCLLALILLFLLFFKKKRTYVFIGVIYFVEFLVFCSCLYMFKVGPYMMALSLVFGFLSTYLSYRFEKAK